MTLVSSFSHLDMDPAKVKPGTGVELLRYYLEYAASGGRRLGDLASTDFPMNSFEAEVFDVLGSRIPLVPQLGASSYRIDLVAQHPKQRGRYVLAIECDGASYHSSPTARDRDRLRQQHLRILAGNFIVYGPRTGLCVRRKKWTARWQLMKMLSRASVIPSWLPKSPRHRPRPIRMRLPSNYRGARYVLTLLGATQSRSIRNGNL